MIEISDKDITILKDAILHYGVNSQLRQLQEECAELIAAINHFARGRDGASLEFLGEFIDVYLMMYQVFLAANEPLEFYVMLDSKMSRLKERLSKE